MITGGGIYPISGQQVSGFPDDWDIEITYSDSSTATYKYCPTTRISDAPGTLDHTGPTYPNNYTLMTYTENGRSIQFNVMGDWYGREP